MVYSSIFLPKYTSLSKATSSSTNFLHPTNFSSSMQCNNNTTTKAIPSSGVVSTSYDPPSINVDCLKSEFSGHGVTFENITGSCVVKMALDDGSVTTLMLPSGLITSYKAPMWHGGTLELLHTCVSETENSQEEEDVLIRGGVSLAFTCQSGKEGEEQVSWSPSTWSLQTVKGDPLELIQVELISGSNSADMVQLKHIVTLQHGFLSSEITLFNLTSSPIRMTGCLISHLNVSTPEATYAIGLEGSNFYSRPPISSNFSIIPPVESSLTNSNDLWGPISELFSMSSGRKEEAGVREETVGEERDNYKHLTERMSMIFTSAPRCFTLIDRGKRNSVEIERNGFDELYMFSPGSSHKWYGKYAYICVGQSALLKPILLAPGGEWRGSQQLHNPNF